MKQAVKVYGKYHVNLRKGSSDYWTVRCIELPAAISQGKTKKEALKNIEEAIALVVKDIADEYKERRRRADDVKTRTPGRVEELVRLTPELHAAMTLAALDRQVSLSEEIESRLKDSPKVQKHLEVIRSEPDVGVLAVNPKILDAKRGR